MNVHMKMFLSLLFSGFLAFNCAGIFATDFGKKGKALIQAVIEEDFVTVGSLLAEKEVDINYRDEKNKDTALMHAAARGNVAMVGFLLQKGAVKTKRNKGGWTAYYMAKVVYEALKEKFNTHDVDDGHVSPVIDHWMHEEDLENYELVLKLLE